MTDERRPYYQIGDTGLEAADVIDALDLNFNLGNVMKYLVRAGRKDASLADLRKARSYLAREIARQEATLPGLEDIAGILREGGEDD